MIRSRLVSSCFNAGNKQPGRETTLYRSICHEAITHGGRRQKADDNPDQYLMKPTTALAHYNVNDADRSADLFLRDVAV